MSTTIGGVRIVDMPDLGVPTSASSIVGESSGSGRFSMPSFNSYLSTQFLPLAGGSVSGDVNFSAPASLNIAGVSGGNQIYIGPWTETSTTGPYGADILIERTYNVDGGAAVTPSSIQVNTTIEGAPALFIWPIAQWTRLRTTAAPDGTTSTGEPMGQHVGIESAMFRELGPSVAFMYHGQMIDSTGLVQGATATIGLELDIQANGPENPETQYYPGQGARAFISLGPTAYPAPAWQANQAYTAGVSIQPTAANGFVYVCSVAGTTGATEPTWPTTDAVVSDGTITWQFGTTHAMQVSRGISFGGSGVGNYPAQFGAGIFMDGSYFYDAMIDLSFGNLVDGGVKAAAIRLGPGMPIDFTGDHTLAGQNVRTLRWVGSAFLAYNVSGTDIFSIADSGAVSIGAPPSGVPGYQIEVLGTNTVGIYTGGGTFTTAMRIGDGQKVSFTSGDTDGLHFVTGKGVTVFNQFLGDVASIGTVGDLSLASGIGVFGHTAVTAKPAATGSKGGNAALASLIALLAAYGLLVDSTT